MYLALRHPHRPGKKGPFAGLDSLSLALLGVGICSMAFHATLRRWMQFSDDLSMLVLGGALCEAVYSIGESESAQALIAISFSILVIGFSTIYILSGNLLFHVLFFVILLALVGSRTLWLIHRTEGRSKEERAQLMRRFYEAVAFLALGFAVWNADLEFCHELRAMRRAVGAPLAWLLEGHGWWHILTAIGAKLYIELIREFQASKLIVKKE